MHSGHRPSFQYLIGREPDRGPWEALYPGLDHAPVVAALERIREAFLLRREDTFRLRPTDQLIDIYRAAYPRRDIPDALEFENLWKTLKKHHGLSEVELDGLTEMNVGDVVSLCWVDMRTT